MERVGVIGAGAMGKGIAANLRKAGYEVIAYKRVIDEKDAKISYLREHEVEITDTLNDIFTSSDILITCLSDSPTLESVIIGEGGLLSCADRKVSVLLDFTTALPESTRKVAALLEKAGISMLDTPMTRGPKEAEAGTINLVVGGDEELYNKYLPLLEITAENIFYAGPVGAGHTTKLVNNFLAMLNRAASSTAALLIQEQGIDLEAFRDFITVSGGNSKSFQGIMKSLINDDFSLSFALKLATKDLRYNRVLFGDSPNELLDVTLKQFGEAEKAGYGEQDTNAIYHHLKSGYSSKS